MKSQDEILNKIEKLELERNSLLAVIERKNASIKLAINMFAANDLDLPNTIETLRDDLALTLGSVRLVEAKKVRIIDGLPTLLGSDRDIGTKLYTIVEGEAE